MAVLQAALSPKRGGLKEYAFLLDFGSIKFVNPKKKGLILSYQY